MSHKGRFQMKSSDEEATAVPAPAAVGQNTRSSSRRSIRSEDEEQLAAASHPRGERSESPSISRPQRPPLRRRRASAVSLMDDQPGPSSRVSRRRRTSPLSLLEDEPRLSSHSARRRHSPSTSDEEPGPSWRRPTSRDGGTDEQDEGTSGNDTDSDEEWTPKRAYAKTKDQYHKRKRHPTHPTRYRRQNPVDIHEPETIASSAHLGPMNNECRFCGALHFKGKFTCCRKGKVFIPPFPKMPAQVEMLLYDVTNSNRATRNKFRQNIIRYNALFGFASIQYDHAPVNKYGVQIAKARGVVRHFPSAAESNRANTFNFGNFYLYEGEEAAKLRMEHPFLAHDLDEAVIRDLTEVFDRNPFARFYFKMGELMKEQEEQELEPHALTMRIINPFEVDINELQGHPGIYSCRREGDYISVYFSASVDQRQLPRGLNIYPRQPVRNFTPKPLFPWLNVTDPLCYPIMRPKGEPGWSPKSFRYLEPKLMAERLEEYNRECREKGIGGRETWDWVPGGDRRSPSSYT